MIRHYGKQAIYLLHVYRDPVTAVEGYNITHEMQWSVIMGNRLFTCYTYVGTRLEVAFINSVLMRAIR